MKRTVNMTAIILIITLLLSGCIGDDTIDKGEEIKNRIESNINFYPWYDSLNIEDEKLYIEICEAIDSFSEDKIYVGEYSSYGDMNKRIEEISKIYWKLRYEQPDYFWADWYDSEYIKNEDKYALYIKLNFVEDKDTCLLMKEEYDSVVERVVSMAKVKPTLYDKVLYVYDYILENTEYYYELSEGTVDYALGYTSYACLIEGKTVCSGYASAFASIMNKLGIECGYEFDMFSGYSFISGGHVWNYCKLDDEYYYFDLTWDDTTFDDVSYLPYIEYSYMYFGVTKTEIEKSHNSIHQDTITPLCNGTKYNYFVYNNYSFSEYDFDEVKHALIRQSGNKCVAIRFDSATETQKAVDDLFNDGNFYTIYTDIQSCEYIVSNSGLHLYVMNMK